jgi:hypothetical protein
LAMQKVHRVTDSFVLPMSLNSRISVFDSSISARLYETLLNPSGAAFSFDEN